MNVREIKQEPEKHSTKKSLIIRILHRGTVSIITSRGIRKPGHVSDTEDTEN
jgi:hypothetical protein